MNCFCCLTSLAICIILFAETAKASDCPRGYECPEVGSTESCMVEVCNDGKCRPKFHAGCFVTKNKGNAWTVDDAGDCANLCDSDSGCKGFSFGKQMIFFNDIGCRLATDMENCKNNLYYIQEPKNLSRRIIGRLMQDPKAPSERYSYTGCYKKKMN